jgi:hypothetical protein
MNKQKLKQLEGSPLWAELQVIVEEQRKRRTDNAPITGEKYWKTKPHPKQKRFLELDSLECLFGGAAGGGKTETLLMAALQHVHAPTYNAIIFRRKFTDLALPSSAMSRAREWLGPKGIHWSDRDKRFTFPSGASLSFGYLDREDDKFRYASAEFQFIAFDELTQFPESWYTFLFSRLRKNMGSNVPLRMRSASNPGGPGHDWVFRRFISKPAEGIVFVPSTLDDNPSVNAEEYDKSLEKLDPVVRKQLREGIWIRDDNGAVFKPTAKNLVDRAPALSAHCLAIDFGFSEDTAFCILGWRENDPNVYVVESFKQVGLTPSAVAEKVRELDETYEFERIVGDIGGLGKGYVEEARQRFGLPIRPAQKKNKRGYIDLLNGDLANGIIRVVEQKNADLLAEMAELPWNEDRTEAERGFADHLCDSLLYGWREAKAFTAEESVEAVTVGTPEWEQHMEELHLKSLEKDPLEQLEEDPWWDEGGGLDWA